jgi:hypothetical protein
MLNMLAVHIDHMTYLRLHDTLFSCQFHIKSYDPINQK